MMKKSILSVLLMLLMVVSLVGCGNKKVSTPPEVDTETTTDIDESVKDDQTTADEDRTEGITSEQTEEESDSADKPTEEATEEVTKAPATKPTEAPTKAPTTKPTEAPTTKPTDTDEKESIKETPFLSDGPQNATYRKVYEIPAVLGNDVISGEITIDELLGNDPRVSMCEERIEYKDQGYIVTVTYNDSKQGISVDSVYTYNNRGEIVNIHRTKFDSENPSGVVSCDIDYIQCHVYGGFLGEVGNCTTDIEVDSEGKIVRINKAGDSGLFQYALYSHDGCYVGDGNAVLQEGNRTIFYDDTTCDVYDVESRENHTVLKDGSCEMICYNSDGKIESISYVSGFNDGKDAEGNTYASINEYLDCVINAGDKVYKEVEWIYDKNGNVLMIQGDDRWLLYVY